MREIDKRSLDLDKIVREYKDTDMCLEYFVFQNYLLDQFLKKEVTYMAINGNIFFKKSISKQTTKNLEQQEKNLLTTFKTKMSQNTATPLPKFERKWNPECISEEVKIELDNIIQKFWNTGHDVTLEAFFEDMYCLDEFTKEEIIYMCLCGDIPFQQIHFSKTDEDFAKARAEAGMENKIEKHYLAAGFHGRIWDPSDLSEPRKQSLDEMIKSHRERPEHQTFDDFFHLEHKGLQKREYIYLELNGGIPFQLLYYAKDDQDFAAARDEVEESIGKQLTPQGRARNDEDVHNIDGKKLVMAEKY